MIGGTSTSDKPGSQDSQGRMYRRWHGAGLLSLAYMGYEAAQSHAAGNDVGSAVRVCTIFHGLAAAIMFFAAVDVKEKEAAQVTVCKALLNPHNLLVLGFMYCAAK